MMTTMCTPSFGGCAVWVTAKGTLSFRKRHASIEPPRSWKNARPARYEGSHTEVDKERESQPDARPHPTRFGVECPAILNKSGACARGPSQYCPSTCR